MRKRRVEVNDLMQSDYVSSIHHHFMCLWLLTEGQERLLSVANMWRCSNCGTGIEDKYAHCWQCGAANAVKKRQEPPPPQKSVPGFASYEELAKVPARPIWIFRRGPLQRIAILLATVIVFKIPSVPFLGTYGVYIVAGVAVIALVIILWRFFRRDPNEGVGVKLN